MPTIALLYHDVVPGGNFESSGFQSPDANIYKLDRQTFQTHLGVIARQALAPQRVSQAAGARARTLLLTFDDGGVSAIHQVAPLLEEHGWPAHFFMTTDYIGKPGFLDAVQLRALRERGHLVGSHSCSHPLRMARSTAAQLEREWRDSTHRLEDILGEAATTASIPGGHYSRRVASTAAAAGVRVLFTSEPVTSVHEVDGCLVVGRFGVQQGVTADWVGAVVAGRPGPRLKRYLYWNAKKLLKAAGGELWLAARRNLLARRGGAR